MCELVEARLPPEEGIALAYRAAAYVTRRVRPAYPGSVEAIRKDDPRFGSLVGV